MFTVRDRPIANRRIADARRHATVEETDELWTHVRRLEEAVFAAQQERDEAIRERDMLIDSPARRLRQRIEDLRDLRAPGAGDRRMAAAMNVHRPQVADDTASESGDSVAGTVADVPDGFERAWEDLMDLEVTFRSVAP